MLCILLFQVVCEVEYKGETLDLSLLTSREGYHIATDSSDDENSQDKSYYINVCRPLNPIQGTLCPPEAAVCEVPQDGIPRVGTKLSYRVQCACTRLSCVKCHKMEYPGWVPSCHDAYVRV